MPIASNAPIGLILAGGKGERIKGKDAREKPLAVVKGVPIVLHVARALTRAGASRVVALTGENHQRILEGLALKGGRGLIVNEGEPIIEIEVRFSGERAGTGGHLLALEP